MKTRKIASFNVSAIGLGCMNLSHAYGAPVSAKQGERVLLTALDQGVDFFDTAALYGFGANETLVGQVMKPHRRKFTLASKCGMQGVEQSDGSKVRVIDGRPETLKKTCEDALRRLQTDVIDLYYLHRWDKQRGRTQRLGAPGQDPDHWFVRSVCQHAAQSPRRAPNRRRADRVFAVDAQPRDRRVASLP
jgi:aryl-alcohol dehydrogenase-like predicted oxidoreductase